MADIERPKGDKSPLLFWKNQRITTYLIFGIIFFIFNYSEVLSEGRTWQMIENTMVMVIGSTALSVSLGLFFAWLVAYSDIRKKSLLQIFILIPFIIPSYIVSLSWTELMGRTGPFASMLDMLPFDIEPLNMYSMGGMIFVLGLSHFPLVYLFTVGVLRSIPRDLEWAAKSGGAPSHRVFREVTLPLALPGLASGGLIAFIANLDNFGIPAFLGIPANITVLSTAIYQEVIGFGSDAFSRAATLSVILAIVALMGTMLQWWLVKKSNQLETTQQDHAPRFTLGRWRIAIETAVWGFLLFITIVPVLSMLRTSLIQAYGLPLTSENATFSHYLFVLFENDRAQSAIMNSIFLAGTTTLFCLIVGTAFAYLRSRRPNALNGILELFIALPYALPGMVLALAMIFMWLEPIPGWNPGIYGTIGILLIAYITRFLILQVRGSATAFSQVDRSMEEAAHVFGAKTMTKWKSILVPLLLPGLLSGALLVFLTALTELTVSSLLWSSGSETIGLVIFNFEQAGYSTYSSAFSTVIVLTILVGMIGYYVLQQIWKKRVNNS
ncbi:ABC transporter permease [Salicibibacter kimchii]|uniref:Iron ABC transporter permease n=1 Tax=Salicibibacter kimchii TaxID=2099786 RepID=A0A345BY60_9BACI|nr:iron ABC transporter permease [Salicibibacter kimchii]AXF55891.1 iron ABC transporter permease [Salicibibacter kimchii]